MEAGCAIVAREGIAHGLVHDRDAWLVPRDAGPDAFADALRVLQRDPDRRARLGRGAREALATRHAWRALARRTLALVDEARRRQPVPQALATRSPSP